MNLETLGIPTTLLFSLGIIIITATFIAYIARALRQPLIPAYILTGLILGPLGLGLIQDSEIIRSLSEIGIAFLLFIVGLELNLNKLKEVGFNSTIIGILQVVSTFFLGFYIAFRLGFMPVESVYLGFILAFSSTLIVVKLLSDKEKLDTLHGRIIIGILLLQDLLVVFILALLPHIGNFSAYLILDALIKGIVLFIVAIVLSKLLLPRIFNFAAKSQELLFLCSITFLFLFTLFAYLLDFSLVIGAFIAGVGLANLPYNLDIIGRVRPLKDFFATIFFVSLGMELLLPTNIDALLMPLLYLLAVVVLFKPFVVLLLSSVFGYEKRTSFLTAISLGQVSEFSLIIVAQGLVLGFVGQQIFSLTILLAVVTIVLTSYIIRHDEQVYMAFSPVLTIFERLALLTQKFGYKARGSSVNIVLFGCHRMGSIFLDTVRRLDKHVMVVDDNPEVIRGLMEEKISCMYGDARNIEILSRLKLEHVRMVISTIPNFEVNSFLVKHVKKINNKTMVFVTANHLHETMKLYHLGTDYVILPHVLSGEIISTMLRKVIKNTKELDRIRREHIKHLIDLKHFGHDHAHCKICKK